MTPARADERSSKVFKKSRRFQAEVKALASRVRQLRRARGWTLEGAAERMDVDLKHLQKVESGDPPINVTLVTLVRMADGLGVPVGQLFTLTRGGKRPR